jgi:peptidoglycan hydrolase CwlO-like protein
MDISKFETLEGRVTAILNKVSELTKKNSDLTDNLHKTQDTLAGTQKELDAAESLIAEMQAEREAILAKVDIILDRLE